VKKKIFIVLLLLICICTLCGCSKKQSATSNEKMSKDSEKITNELDSTEETTDEEEDKTTKKSAPEASGEPIHANAIVKENSVYDCDIKADQADFDGEIENLVGDKYFATQINDWYMYFDQYEGQTVEIEGYYIGDYRPYDFIGRYGPSCPYCQGGYVSFEILSDEDLTQYESGKDWIKVKGILRQGIDSKEGPFYYIEVLDLEKMDEVGQDTVTN